VRGRGTGRWLIVLHSATISKASQRAAKPRAQKSMTDTGNSLLQHFYALRDSPPSDKLLRQIILRDYKDAQETL
jgi:hypothetical protein